MAEPISILASFLTIATALAQTSSKVASLVASVKEGPKEIKTISRDASALSAVLSSLSGFLGDEDLQATLANERRVVGMLQNLQYSLKNCDELLVQILNKVKKHMKSDRRGKGLRSNFACIQWSFLGREEVRLLQVQLEAAKSTLHSVSITIIMLCSIRLLASGNPSKPQAVTSCSKALRSDLAYTPHPARSGIDRVGNGLRVASSHTSDACSKSIVSNDQFEATCTADLFYDCISEISSTLSATSFNEGSRELSGSAYNLFDRCCSVYPEQYTVEGMFAMPVFTFAVMQIPGDIPTRKYFLTYAETARTRRRITVLATFPKACSHSTAILRTVDYSRNEFGCVVLPDVLLTLFKNLFADMEFFYSVTTLSLSLNQRENGQLAIEATDVHVGRDEGESESLDDTQILQDLEDLGCASFTEREVIVLSRLSSTCFKALIRSQSCVEQQLPFKSAGGRSAQRSRNYFKDLKSLHAIRGLTGVVQFIGVVLDEMRSSLKSYLYEMPLVGSIMHLFGHLGQDSRLIPWPIREIWARQIVEAISDVHGRNLVVGLPSLHSIALRADGRAILAFIGSPRKWPEDEYGNLPPECRNASEVDDGNPREVMNFRTDIFQLGMILWKLAQHQARLEGYFCRLYGCTSTPRYLCTAVHTNPVELPRCNVNVPPYFVDIIDQCRVLNPSQRPPARRLLTKMRLVGDTLPEEMLRNLHKVLDSYGDRLESFWGIYCDECGALSSDVHYHCYSCTDHDFDVCQVCRAQGVRCYDHEHKLVRRILRNGISVDDP